MSIPITHTSRDEFSATPRRSKEESAGKFAETNINKGDKTPGSPPLAQSIDEFCRENNVGRTKTYQALNDGKLGAVKWGRRTLILTESARELMASLPTYRPQSKSGAAR
jgi:hypothetical protein